MIEKMTVEVPAPSGTQKRDLYCYLPRSYDGKRHFPVLYMFDGQTVFFDETSPFGDSLRMGDLLDTLNADLIVAAVECDKADRLTEYSPFPFTSRYGNSEGKGEVYIDWLVRVLKPAIDAKYRTYVAKNYLSGSSMGGLMTVYGLCRYPNVFKGGAAQSPSLWVDPEGCETLIRSADLRRKPVFYIDYGTKELKSHGKAQELALERCIGALTERGVPLAFRLIEGGEHSEKSWREQVPVFLKTLGLI